MNSEKIILGIDPGTRAMGYGLIRCENQQMKIIQMGVILLSKYKNHELRLKKIFEKISFLIEEYLPDEMALEAPFYGKNVQSMLKLGRAQGMAMAAALVKQIPISEYAPKKVKLSITGNGNASKEQVALVTQKLLKFKEIPSLLDATDALAVAICHHFNQNNQYSAQKKCTGSKKSTTKWESFIKSNPDRIR